MSEFKYRSDIDGLRAIAVIIVLLFHAGLGFTGGFVGVDIFFVISGFLITSLIQKGYQGGTFNIIDFWVRRIRRIVPASILVVVLTLFAGYFLLLPDDYVELAKSSVFQQLMCSNLFFWKNTGYFHGPAELKPLLHTWSLSVEEQFYLGYPLALMGLLRVSRRVTFLFLVVTMMTSFALSVYGVTYHPSATFYFLPTRAWEMLLGGVVSFLPTSGRRRDGQLEILSWLSLCGIFIATFSFSSSTPFPGTAALIPCGAAAALIYANASQLTRVGLLLSSRPLVYVGLISYSLYLWHWPVLVFLRYVSIDNPSVPQRIMALAASFVFAHLSYRFVEIPFRKSLLQNTGGVVLKSALLSSFVVIAFSAIVVSLDGVRSRFSVTTLKLLDVAPLPDQLATYDIDKVTRGELPSLGIAGRQNEVGGVQKVGELPESLDFVVWGDSHALPLSRLMDKTARDLKLAGKLACLPGCVPVLDAWRPSAEMMERNWNRAVFEWICDNDVRNVILVCRWEARIEVDHIVSSDTFNRGAEDAMRVLQRGLTQTISSLERRGIGVVVLGQVPLQKVDPRKIAMMSSLGRRLPEGVSLQEHLRTQAKCMTVLSSLKTGHTFVDPTPFCFDEEGNSKVGDRDGAFYFDDDHLSMHGAEVLLSPLVVSLFTDIATEKQSAVSGSPGR